MGKFFRRGVTAIMEVPVIANPAAPSRVELDAGEDFSLRIADISGWQLNNSPIPVPNLAEVFTSQIPGEDTVSDSTLTFYDDDTDDALRTLLAKGTTTNIVIMPYGDLATQRAQVYEVRVTGVNDEFSIGNDAARFVAGFAILSAPELNAVIPAAA